MRRVWRRRYWCCKWLIQLNRFVGTHTGFASRLNCSLVWSQESLESEVTPDPMEGEQTWPSEEELKEAEGEE